MRAFKLFLASFRSNNSRSLFQKAAASLVRANQEYIAEVSTLSGEIATKESKKAQLEKEIEANRKLASDIGKLLS